MINIWTILGVMVAILLIVFWNKKGAAWGGLTIGVIIGLMVSTIYLLKGNEFSWTFIGKGAVLGAIAGFLSELLGKISGFIKKRN